MAHLRTDADGRFRFRLDPGSYTIRATSQAAMSCDETTFEVPAQGYATVRITCDTGIR